MSRIPLHLSLPLLLAVCTSTAAAFTLKYDGKSSDGKVVLLSAGHVSRLKRGNSPGEEVGFPSTSPTSDSQYRQSAHNQHTTSKQVIEDKEVISKHSKQSGEDYTYHSHRDRKFQESGRRVLRDENSVYGDGENEIGHSEALSQEVSKSDLQYTIPKMVVVVSTTVAALFGMCVMAAIFQCCCRKKRTTSESEPDDAIKTDAEEKQKSKSASPEKDTAKPDEATEKTENDRLLADEDLGDFSAVQRETEILKSFRKPPPPKNRARASRVPRMKAAASKEDGFSLIKEEAEGSIKSKSSSRRTSPEKKETKEENDEKEEKGEEKGEKEMEKEKEEVCGESPKQEHKRLSFEAAKQMVDSMLAEVKEKEKEKEKDEKGDITVAIAEPVEPTAESAEEPAHVNGIQPVGGNIFMQIDPTVKIQDPNEKKSKIPVRSSHSSPTSSPGEGASLRPTSANKDQRKFLVPSVHGEQMDQLVKSLKTRLKEDKGQTCLSDRNLATNKVAPSGSDDDTEPKGRERSHSDPTKNLLSVKATHV